MLCAGRKRVGEGAIDGLLKSRRKKRRKRREGGGKKKEGFLLRFRSALTARKPIGKTDVSF